MGTRENGPKNQDRYQSFFESAYDAILIADPQTGMIVEANQEAEKLFGVSRAKLTKMHQAQLHPPDEQERYKKIFKTHIDKKSAFEEDLVIINKEGRPAHVSVRANLINIGGKEFLHGIFHVIDKFKEEEEFLLKKIGALEDVLRFIKAREEKIVILKKEVDSLLKQLGKTSKYGY